MDALLAALKAAAEPTRLRLVALLARAELTVTELTHILGQSQPRVSRHLKLMVEAKLIERYQEGSWAFYRLNDAGVGGALGVRLIELLPDQDEELARDAERLETVLDERRERAQSFFADNAAEWDRIRALYIPEEAVEAALLDAAKDHRIETMLDLGTGTGRILQVFADKIRHGIGIDLSLDMLSVARANLSAASVGHVQVRRGDLLALPFGDNQFDLITVHQVLHFLDKPARALAEAARVLAPGGLLLVADFAPHSLEYLREEQAHRRLGFADDEIADALRMAGLAPRDPVHLKPEKGSDAKLTVTLWAGEAPANVKSNSQRMSA